MVQALQTEDCSLLQGLTVQNTYTELRRGSKKGSHGGKEWYGLPTDPLEEDPSGLGSSGTPSAWTTHGGLVVGGGWWAPVSSYPPTDCQTKTWEIIWWTGFEWVGCLAPGACRCHPMAPGQIPWCVFVGSSRIGLYPLYRTHSKSNRWHLH